MLSKREMEILKLIAWDCLSAKEIADKLCISPITAQNHIHNIKDKLSLRKMTELSKFWFLHYAKNIGATLLLLLFSFQLFNVNATDMRIRRARGRRRETECVYGLDN